MPSRGGENAGAKGGQGSPAVAEALQQLDAMHVPFDRPVGPVEREGRVHRSAIRVDPAGEAHEGWQSARASIREEGVKATVVSLLDNLSESLHQSVGLRQLSILLQEVLQGAAFLLVQLLGWAQAEPARGQPPLLASLAPPFSAREAETAPPQQGLPHQRTARGVALRLDLSAELRDVGAAGLPATFQVGHERRQGGRADPRQRSRRAGPIPWWLRGGQ